MRVASLIEGFGRNFFSLDFSNLTPHVPDSPRNLPVRQIIDVSQLGVRRDDVGFVHPNPILSLAEQGMVEAMCDRD